jgi:membrane-bound lytic murein transglycosylase B
MTSPNRPPRPLLPTLLLPALLGSVLSVGAPLHAAQADSAAAPAAQHKSSKSKVHRHKKKTAPAAAKTDYVGEAVGFGQWKAVDAFAGAMVAKHGFDRAELDALIAQVRFVDTAVELVKPGPPGKPKNWHAYSNLFIEPVRIAAGVKFWNDNADALERAQAQYGVPAEIIVGIIGVETVYGRNTGRFRIMDVLTTLAFAYPESPNRLERMEFFRGELENTLLLARKYKLDPLSLQGSFAGAIGLPQFMPSSVLQFGVDFDGDGLVDVRGSPADAIGSVANYLVQHGWQRDDPGAIVYTARVSAGRAWEGLIGKELTANHAQEELAAVGVASNVALPPGMRFGLVDLQNGADPTEYWLGTNNFFAITQYNRSYFYAMSVVELGRAVRLSRTPPAAPAGI